MEMLKKGRLCIYFKSTFLLPMDTILLKLTSRISHKAKENRQELVNLYKDLEACGGYTDIQVMWEMIHSSYPSNFPKTKVTKNLSH